MPRLLYRRLSLHERLLSDLSPEDRARLQLRLDNAGDEHRDTERTTLDGLIVQGVDPLVEERARRRALLEERRAQEREHGR